MNRFHPISIAVTALILILGGTSGVKHQRRLTELKAQENILGSHLSTTGKAGSLEDPRPEITKRQRADLRAKALDIASNLVVMIREMEAREESGSEADPEFDRRAAGLMESLMEMDASQVRTIIEKIRDAGDLADENKRNVIGLSLMLLGEDRPAEALDLFTTFKELSAGGQLGKHVVSTILEQWATADPVGAMRWVEKNGSITAVEGDVKINVITGIAGTDPKLAFRLLDEMGLGKDEAAVSAIVESGKSPEQRTSIVQALRERLDTLPPGPERNAVMEASLEGMARNLTDEDFDSVQKWMQATALDPKESAQFVAGLSYFNTKEDTGRWIDWMSDHLPAGQARENTANLVGQWTQQDYLAAGKWLSAAPEGPAKIAAVATYAATVAEYEPQTAVQWALTLPEGSDRTNTLEEIYQNWPGNDAAAASDFAAKYGIDTEPFKEAP